MLLFLQVELPVQIYQNCECFQKVVLLMNFVCFYQLVYHLIYALGCLQARKTNYFCPTTLPKKRVAQGPTITATSLPDDFVHFSQARSLTVREWARLQMFPDWYQFTGKRTTGGIRRAGNPQKGIFDREVPKYTQIGNAVPVELARRIGTSIKKIIT